MTDIRSSIQAALGDRYEVGDEVGRGGMATVYRARDRHLGRDVAVKVLRPELSQFLGADRFHQEVSIAAALQHPNIVPLHESGEDAGLLYYTMPFVEGETLRQRLERETELPLDDALQIAQDVGEALRCAHQHGIVHRDIKPENILLTAGHAMVADFGVARAVSRVPTERLTSMGIVVGTPAYMSPEQASGSEHLDGRVDIYALGCVLYEMLGGEPPFTGPSAQAVLARQLHESPRSLHVVRPAVTPALESVIGTALAKVPADRYATVEAFLAALARARRASGALGGVVGTVRRHRVAWVAAIVAAVVLAFAVRLWVGRNAYAEGLRAFNAWNLKRARRMFTRAVRADPGNAQAHFYLAQAGVLEARPVGDWRAAAQSAVVHAGRLLTANDSARAYGLLFLADSEYDKACEEYTGALARDSLDALAWFDLGECRRRDRAVVRDPRSSTGWRFRSSYQGAVDAYQRALDIAPLLNQAFGSSVYDRLATLLVAEPYFVRNGEALQPDTGLFVAYPALDHDTLLLVPHRAANVGVHPPPSHAAAIDKGRVLLEDVVRRWLRVDSTSAPAHATLAVVLELSGELARNGSDRRGALEEIREARRLERDPVQRVGDAMVELRLDLKRLRFGRARALADSLLVATPDPDSTSAWNLACAAALVGRAHLTARLLGRAASAQIFETPMTKTGPLPRPVAVAGLRLLAYAALGAPAESLPSLERQVDTALWRYVPRERQDAVRRQIEKISDLVGFPVRGLRAEPSPEGPDWLSTAEWSLAQGDTLAARDTLEAARPRQAMLGPSDLLPSMVYLQSWLSLAVRDSAGAAWLLGFSLDNLAAAPTMLVGEPQQAGSLVRAMALRARLAAARNDLATAHRWAARVDTLWSGSDVPELRSLVDSLRAL